MAGYMSDGSDSETEHTASVWNTNSHVLVAIDCSDSMFLEDEALNGLSAFQTVFRALYSINDGLVLKRSNKNKIAVMLFHPDQTKRIFVDFDTPFLDALLKTQELSKRSLTDLSEYSTKGCNMNYSFSQFLIECKKKFYKLDKADLRHLFYITNNADPCNGDAAVKFQSLQEFKDLPQSKIIFELLPLIENLDDSLFYSEAFMNYGGTLPKFYYNQHFLTTKIKGAITFKFITRNIRLYISNNSDSSYIGCSQISCTKNAKILPNMCVTKDTEEEVFKKTEISPDEKFRVEVSADITESMTINKMEKDLIRTTKTIKKGLTIIHATRDKYSTLGENLKHPRLIKSLKTGDQEFEALWMACVNEGFNLQCYLKYKDGGKIYSVELIPKIMNQEKHFLVLVIPHAINYSKPAIRTVATTKCEELGSLLDDLVKKGTIKNYDLTKVKPYKFQKQLKYFKNELFKTNYKDNEDSIDFVNKKQYEGDVFEIVERLNTLFESQKGTKRGKSATGKTTKRGKKEVN